MTRIQLIKRLKQLITEKGSQRNVSEYFGISPAYLSDVLAGKRNAGPKILDKLDLQAEIVYVSKERVA